MDDFIFSYTADDAINDGYLFDVSQTAKQVGFVWPVRITLGVKEKLSPKEKEKNIGQSYEGRLWDLLNVAFWSIKKNPEDRMAEFKLKIQKSDRLNKNYIFWALVDTTSGPAIHIILPEEY